MAEKDVVGTPAEKIIITLLFLILVGGGVLLLTGRSRNLYGPE
jgi:hypothetical protein